MEEQSSSLSLVRLAEIDELPDRQCMDAETLNWIKENSPFSNWSRKVPPTIVESLSKVITSRFAPSVRWFKIEDAAYGIHGVRHMYRVALHSSLLADILFVSNAVRQSTLIAACVHDVRRVSDKRDDDHGQRAANWLCENHHLVEVVLGQTIDEPVICAAAAAVELHDKSYGHFSDADNIMYRQHKQVIDLIKTADALDRYRLPKTKWWIDDGSLKLTTGGDIKHFCFQLVTASELLYLQGYSSVEAVKIAVISLIGGT